MKLETAFQKIQNHSRHRLLSALLSLSLLLLGSTLSAQSTSVEIDINPAHPTTNDIVEFRFHGTWNNGCVPKFHSGRIHSNVITVDLVTSKGPCTQAFTPWQEFVHTTDPLAAGNYTVVAKIDGKQRASKHFTVTQAHHAPTVQFRHAQVNVSESGHTATLWVERVGSTQGTSEVRFRTQDGTATAGHDYEHTSGTLFWKHGDSHAKEITVRILNDHTVEHDEDFTVVLEHPKGADLGHPSHARVVIEDDDQHARPTVQFRSEHVTVSESSFTATLYVERSGSTQGRSEVRFETVEGSAIAGHDFEYTSGTLTWDHGDTSAKQISVRIYNDHDAEHDENFRVVLRHRDNAELGHASSAQVIIEDDDNTQPTNNCKSDGKALCLQKGRFEVRVKWETPQGKKGTGNAGTFTDETGYFWFFNSKNIEVFIKVLDGCGINDTYWVYIGGLTNIWVEVVVTDTETGETKSWTNPMNQSFRPIDDTGYFDCVRR